MLLQLHMKSVLDRKAIPHTGPVLEAAGPPIAAEFIVGPGATFKEDFPHTATLKEHSKDAVLRTKRSNLRLLEPSQKPDPEVNVLESVSAGVSGPREERRPVIGRQQMEVISELLEKGSVLRDKMVQSLTAGTQLEKYDR